MANPLNIPQGQIAHVKGIDLWYETFGKKQNPAVLLITGAGCQGVLWEEAFCKKLAFEGFYVIRYDHRDAGLSTCVDFKKNPYSLIDLAKDAVGLLDIIGIKKAHLFGFSMGAFLSEILSVHFPEKVLSILLLGSTCDIHPMNRAFAGLPPEKDQTLSSPSKDYLESTFKLLKLMETPVTEEEQLELRIEGWRHLNGRGIPLDERTIKGMLKLFIARLRNPQAVFNHMTMLQDQGSEAVVRTVPTQVKVPTVILQGSGDPIFAPDHGEALSKVIINSEFYLLEGQGHIPHEHFYETYIDILKRQAKG